MRRRRRAIRKLDNLEDDRKYGNSDEEDDDDDDDKKYDNGDSVGDDKEAVSYHAPVAEPPDEQGVAKHPPLGPVEHLPILVVVLHADSNSVRLHLGTCQPQLVNLHLYLIVFANVCVLYFHQ